MCLQNGAYLAIDIAVSESTARASVWMHGCVWARGYRPVDEQVVGAVEVLVDGGGEGLLVAADDLGAGVLVVVELAVRERL